ncbi:hypothetical protein BKA58DRAFT_325153 [Alternaria rosae]|uniref:uncharacterized protein n=1 Tax=Alternaria rosae TaxID=1187941 RepID=UPI001E8E32CD|nr:uncharacterized protein BKA58DRAFT_325153 [Alternaria rosae]KAH6857387.1 hypothetical protein BKA58DRAFT_325153 [Alternaria rosae]
MPSITQVTNSAWNSKPPSQPSPPPRPSPPSGDRPSGYPANRPWPPYEGPTPSSQNWQSSASATTPYADHLPTTSPWTTSTSTPSPDPFGPPTPTNIFPGATLPLPGKQSNNTPIYAAAAIIPVVVLALTASVIFLCVRKRKRRRAAALAAEREVQEMKMTTPSQISRRYGNEHVQPYIAPPLSHPPPVLPAISASHHQQQRNSHLLPPTSTPSAFHPIILGPIGGSSSNNAYLTGMDTSDMVSVSSNTLRPIEDPFGDNSSLSEPPPPYRPCSLPPPSFTTERGAPPSFTSGSGSRGSSIMEGIEREVGGGEGGMGSRAHLIERSPFDDPDDRVSEISGPTFGRNGEGAESAVSDLEYQRETFDEFSRRGFS